MSRVMTGFPVRPIFRVHSKKGEIAVDAQCSPHGFSTRVQVGGSYSLIHSDTAALSLSFLSI